jgi:hypothetical protein
MVRSPIPHPDCEVLAKQEVRKTNPGESAEQYWDRVRQSMPPYYWNRIRQAEHGRCEWCNQPLFEEVGA